MKNSRKVVTCFSKAVAVGAPIKRRLIRFSIDPESPEAQHTKMRREESFKLTLSENKNNSLLQRTFALHAP